MSQVTLRRPLNELSAERFRDRLAQEFREPAEGLKQPLFQIDRPGEKDHVIVIWDEWRDLPLRERALIVLDAYEQVFGEVRSQEVSVAMGLTSDEAQRLGYAL